MASIGVKVYLEGAAEYRQKMSEMTSQTKLYQAQMKNLQSQLGKSTFSKSIQESKVLAQELKTLREKSALLEQRIKEATAAYGADSKEVRNLTTQYEKLQAQINKVDGELREHGGVLGAVGSQMQEVGQKMQAVGDKIAGVGDKLTRTITLPIVGAGVAAVKAAADWESAFTGVMKTVEETATTSYDAIAEGIKKMATETASTKEEIAGVAEVAGQLGVSADDIIEFTKTMVMLGDTTNLSADEAASSLAKFMNVTGESQKNVDRIGSTIVALGNNFATTESDIVAMSTRLAAAGSIAGMSSTDILALSTAMSSVGIEAEAGGTAMSQTMTAISKAVDKGGAKLDQIAKIAGVTADEFSAKWKSKPSEALQSFIGGLGKLNEEGESTYTMLDDLGMSGIRQSNMLQALSLASDELGRALSMSNEAYQENNALTDEAAKRYETFEAKLSQMKEKIGNVAIEIGERLMPYLERGLDVVDQLIAKWDQLSPDMQDAIIKAAAIAAAIGPILAVGGRLISGLGSITSGVGMLMQNLPAIGAAIGGIGAPIIAIVAAIAALVAGFVALYNTNDEFKAVVDETWTTIKELIGEVCASIGELVGALVERLREFWAKHGEEITAIMTALFTALSYIIEVALQAIKTIIDFWTAIISGDWQGAWDAIKAYFEILLTSTVTILRTILEGAYTFFVDILKRIGAFNNSILNSIKQTILNALTSIVNYLTQKLNTAIQTVRNVCESVKSTISGMINSVTSTITGLLNKAYTWGSDFINGFKDGIKNGVQNVLNEVQSMAQGVKDMIHFSHPDKGPLKDFDSWPRDMMQQYAAGIEAGRYLVQHAISDVTADVAILQGDTLSADEIYNAVNAGASNASPTIVIGDRELGRALRDMGVVMV